MAVNQMEVLKQTLNAESVQKQFANALGSIDKAKSFIADVITMSSNSNLLAKCDVNEIVKLCSQAAMLDLSFSRKQAFIVPFSDKGKVVPTFIISADGWRELALRTREYIKIKSLAVYEGEIESYNRFTDEIHFGDRKSDTVVGYYAAFTLINGMHQAVYWDLRTMATHAKRYSPSIRYDKNVTVESLMKAANDPNATGQGWTGVFNAMARKTLLTNLLKHEGFFSTEMEMASRIENINVPASRDEQIASNANTEEIEAEEVKAAPAAEAKPADDVPPFMQ